jgi:quinol-cytochrome oxidoreductase complex cytochrome b subunit
MSDSPEENSVPFYPDHLSQEAKVALGLGIGLIVIGIIGIFAPVGLGAPADPMDTPIHIKPEWYFLSLYQLLRFIPETIGATAPVIGLLLIAMLPFLDRKEDQNARIVRIRFWIAAAAVILFIGLTIWGEVS